VHDICRGNISTSPRSMAATYGYIFTYFLPDKQPMARYGKTSLVAYYKYSTASLEQSLRTAKAHFRLDDLE